jgi:protein O-GlcNAc transferase
VSFIIRFYSDQYLKQIPTSRPLAISLHRAGHLRDAERLYRLILDTAPQHPDANHNLGMLSMQSDNPDAGLLHLKTALEAHPSQGQFWLSYITALIRTGRLPSEKASQQGE